MKKITIEIDSQEENERIEAYVRAWLQDNFWKGNKAEVTINER